jgi:D-lyxose ketol-isomerase
MITNREVESARARAARMIDVAGIPIRAEEIQRIEVADFGLGNLEVEGAQILTLFQSMRFGVKLIVMFPGQTLPEHWHPPVGDDPGKEEVIRVYWGRFSICTPGGDGMSRARPPQGKDSVYTCRNELIMAPGDQLLIEPGTKHWFQAGPEGAVVGSYSSVARDAHDLFTDPNVVRGTVVVGSTVDKSGKRA